MQDQPDLIQEGFRRASYAGAVQNMRWLVTVLEIACVSIPILLALILWRVW